MAKILIAEDEVSVSAFVERALGHAGHQVKTAPDGLAAVAALALKAGKDYPAMKILLMSGYASERQRAHNLDALAHRIIAKPFSLAEITAAVAETLKA
jgi:DNA-binding response OmpR family regulator